MLSADNITLTADNVSLTADLVRAIDPANVKRSDFVRREGEQYAQAMLDCLPQGVAWPRDEDSALSRLALSFGHLWADPIDRRAADLLENESDPRKAFELLPEWERAFGLPDDCLDEPLTIGDRQRILVQRITMLGGASRPFFIDLAAQLGYTISILEFSPFMVGISQVGDTSATGSPGELMRWEIGDLTMRFYWVVKVGLARLTWFRVGPGGGQVGVDPHLRIAQATDLECIIRRWKPAHTEVIFDYSGLGVPDPMAGLP